MKKPTPIANRIFRNLQQTTKPLGIFINNYSRGQGYQLECHEVDELHPTWIDDKEFLGVYDRRIASSDLFEDIKYHLEANMSQNDQLLKYLRKHGSITRLEAVSKLGIMNLWQRVSELENTGCVFDRLSVKRKNRLGENRRYTKYTLLAERKAA